MRKCVEQKYIQRDLIVPEHERTLLLEEQNYDTHIERQEGIIISEETIEEMEQEGEALLDENVVKEVGEIKDEVEPDLTVTEEAKKFLEDENYNILNKEKQNDINEGMIVEIEQKESEAHLGHEVRNEIAEIERETKSKKHKRVEENWKNQQPKSKGIKVTLI
ncbi:hypothetical protein NQ314_008077 [Rhamnusium bicolor]|uniref:Uncharacterized protein n=1 Tax=Rhamnusium bicolor TaxID=1586634 RepID=A0AAV8YF85_9CUCU|nr:hypothetical protein NQ314_008077 [Rhamnusium bicolor]